MTYLRSVMPPTALSFGVVCKADWLFDIAIRSTSQSLKRKKDYPPKKAQQLYGRPDVEYFMPEPHAEDEKEFAVLGFGTAYPAYIVLTDDCAIAKCRLTQRASAHGLGDPGTALSPCPGGSRGSCAYHHSQPIPLAQGRELRH
jgi:hypothetical protein